MGAKEHNLQVKTERALTRWQRLWRINSGSAWAGKIVDRKNGFLRLANFRRFIGAPAGFPDMIGFDSIEITPDMVGKRVAVFVGVELKATKHDKLNEKQKRFRDLIVQLGGIHREVRD